MRAATTPGSHIRVAGRSDSTAHTSSGVALMLTVFRMVGMGGPFFDEIVLTVVTAGQVPIHRDAGRRSSLNP
jgi:hypothetical protein